MEGEHLCDPVSPREKPGSGIVPAEELCGTGGCEAGPGIKQFSAKETKNPKNALLVFDSRSETM
jgi:hypothetical protein